MLISWTSSAVASWMWIRRLRRSSGVGADRIKGGKKKMSDEKKRVLEMLAAGDIDAEEAERLLSALEPAERRPGSGSKGSSFNWLKIKVYEGNMDKPKVNVRIPLSI